MRFAHAKRRDPATEAKREEVRAKKQANPNSVVKPYAAKKTGSGGPGGQRGKQAPPPLPVPSKPRNEQIRYQFVRLVDPDTDTLSPLILRSQAIEFARNYTPPADLNRPPAEDADEDEFDEDEEGEEDEDGEDGEEDMPMKRSERKRLKALAKKAEKEAKKQADQGAEEASSPKQGNSKKWKRDRFCIELVTEKPEPIVKIVDLAADYHKAKEQNKKKKEISKVREKEIQMTWSVDVGDREHKMMKTREALAEGARVVIAFTRKKGQKFISPEERQQKMAEVVQELSDVAEEYKARAMPGLNAFIYLRPLGKS